MAVVLCAIICNPIALHGYASKYDIGHIASISSSGKSLHKVTGRFVYFDLNVKEPLAKNGSDYIDVRNYPK